eukprot:SAG31_NODE_1804_length_7234_cov_3.340855_4_plen_126_part_00
MERHGIRNRRYQEPFLAVAPLITIVCELTLASAVVLTYETGYGGISTLFVLPNGEALCVAWQGDNTGPAPLESVQEFYAHLEKQYPEADVVASTFDSFFAVANRKEIKSLLPVITQEIEVRNQSL